MNARFRPLIPLIALSITIAAYGRAANAAEKEPDYAALYVKGEYAKALEIVLKKQSAIYDTMVTEKRVPTAFITMKKAERGIAINKLFHKRRVRGFFIENHKELSGLHLAAARCYFKLDKNDQALNHYVQALRFKTVEFQQDDVIAWEIAQVYKKMHLIPPYLNALETAYSLNNEKYEYSLELGRALYPSGDPKKAIFHLERYIREQGDAVKDPSLYLMIGNLSETIGRYLDTVRYYKKYLALKPDDGNIHFALGHLAFKNTGDYAAAQESLRKSLKLLPENDLFRRGKAHEYLAEMHLGELEFDKAADAYTTAINYQKDILDDIAKRKNAILKIRTDINRIKSSLIKNQDYDKFNEYEFKREEEGRIESLFKKKNYDLQKLDSGKVRWNLAYAYERIGKLDLAVRYYREAIAHNYNSNDARERIVKLELKIKRGY